MNVSITVRHCGETTTLRAEAGTPLAPLLREAGLLTLPCGVGKCGKCLILAATEPCAEERALLGDAALASGLRLACYTRAAEGLDIALPQAGALRVLTRFAQSDYPFRPIVEGAGGIVTDWAGAPLTLESSGQLLGAGDAKVHRQALDLIQPSSPLSPSHS